MTTVKERRKSSRIEQDEKLLIQIVASSKDPSLVGATVACTTRDVSSDGLQIQLGHKVVESCLLDLWVELKSANKRFFLSGEVRWSRRGEEEKAFLIGVELKDKISTDYQEWQGIFS